MWVLLPGAVILPVETAHCETGAYVSPGGQSYWVEQVAEGLRFPSGMVWLPGGDMLIAERMGGLRLVRDGKLESETIGGVPASFQSAAADGIKDVALDPEFSSTRALYLSMSEGTLDQRHAAIYRARLEGKGLRDVERIFRSKDDIGGIYRSIASRIIVLTDKTLLFGVADDQKEHAQKLDSHLGKILRINRDGSIPRDNPFLSTPGALPEIWSYGHRVPLGLFQDRTTGEVWETESGPRGGDELNLIKAGSNYGWARASWGFDYTGGVVAPQQFSADIEDAVLVWTPSVTPAGLTRYLGNTYAQWKGDFLMGNLSGKAVVRVRVTEGKVDLQETLLRDLDERIREVKTGPDGYLYLLTDHQNGRLLRLRPGQPSADQLSRVAKRLERSWALPDARISDKDLGDPIRGKEAFLRHCAGCHSVGAVVKGANLGPDLAGVFGRRAGTKEGFNYSKGLAKATWDWNVGMLEAFLADPNFVVPGTLMSAPPATDLKERYAIIRFLKEQGAN